MNNNLGRTLTFVLLASSVMMLSIVLQNYFYPPVPADIAQQKANAAEKAEQDQASDNTDEPTADLNTTADQSNENGESNSPDGADGADVSIANSTQESEQPKLSAAPENKDDSTPSSEVAADTEPSKSSQELFLLGSVAADSNYRFLVTLNNIGGTVRRVELNARNKRGRFKYRELEKKGGYLGNLELTDSPEGPVVQTVGDGTPANVAGIQKGDVIKSVIGPSGSLELIAGAEDFEVQRQKTKAGESFSVNIARDGENQSLQIELTDGPIEILRPEPNTVDEFYDFPEGFVFTLHQYLSNSDWVELDQRMKTDPWEAKQVTDNGVSKVEFSYTIPADLLSGEKFSSGGIAGPLRVVKRYWLDQLTTEEVADLDSKSWDLNLEIEIENLSDQKVELGYQLNGPTGVVTEGWWYQIKIHGNWSALFSMAGARDVVSASKGDPFIFYGTPDIVKNAKKTLPKNQWIFPPPPGDKTEFQQVKYIGVDAQYFNVSLLPEGDFFCYSALPWHTGAELPTDTKLQRLVDVTPMLFNDVELEAGAKYSQTFNIFCGPKEPKLLESYGLEETRTYGWFGFVSKPLCWLLKVFYWMTGQFSYAIPIILLTVLVRSIMIPFSRRANLNAQMMQHLQPQIKEIADKYKDDMEKRASAQRELFKKHNYNPFGGCFMMFFQLPIFIGLYRGLSVDIALRDQPLIPGVEWCSNLSAPDQFLNWQSWMPGFLASETGWLGPYLNILPIVTMVLFILQQKLFMPPATDDQQKMMQNMMKYMMIFMGFLFFKVPAGLCIYFITSSIWGILERKLLPKPVLNADKLGLEGSGASTSASDVEQPAELSNAEALADRKRRKKERERRLRDRE